ncbi:MAG: type II toxin-antitoxin system VapB family antitoxin [Rhizobiales bacterium]|nr:type II toxin-antitoxin system VapB family antitoxin [Hyphomicrobiales bacterium]
MRISIEIDDKLMKQAMKASGAATKRETVEKALELLVRTSGKKAVRGPRGKSQGEGGLDAMRRE